MTVDTFLDDLFLRGVVLWADGDQLGLRGAKGVVTPEIVAQLKAQKTEILRSLSQPVQRYPLSHGQEALWFMAQNTPDSPLYNVSIALRVHSPVDVQALQRTFQAFIVRHPLLRTTFHVSDGKPEQVVQRYQPLAFTATEAPGWDDPKLDAAVLQAHEEIFDLAQGPLMRVHLFSRAEDDHVLLCTLHHIITDGWSLWMLLDEFRHLYPAARKGSLSSASLSALPQATQSYADYVAWQRETMEQDGDRLWAYWREQLAGDLPVLDLPTDRPRPRMQSYRGASHHFTLDPALAQGLRQLAHSAGTTLYTLLLSGFQIFLHRAAGQEEILVGSPTAGRSKSEFAPIFGYFTSPVVLRGNLAHNPSFREFLEQMRGTVLDALGHQDFPFGLLQDRLGVDRDPSRPPLYQATFALQKPQQTDHILNSLASQTNTEQNWGGLLLSPYELGQYQGRVDLMLEVIETTGPLMATLRYSTDLFDESTIAAMTRRFVILLQSVLQNPQQKVGHLPWLTDEEKEQILVDWNQTQAPYPQDLCAHQIFAAQAERTPDAEALVFVHPTEGVGEPVRYTRLTYAQLNRRANQLAHYLQSLGVGKDEDEESLVGICLHHSLESVVSILAVLKAGGAYVPIDPLYPADRVAFMVEDAGLTRLITTESIVADLPDFAGTLICLDQIEAELAQQPAENPSSQVTPQSLAYVIYTSGSTGRPKGVMVEHKGIPNLAYAQMEAFGVHAQSRVLQFASFSFDASVSELFKTLLAGGTLYMADRATLLPGPELVTLFKREAITMVTLSPSVLAALPFDPLPDLQSLIVAGEACPIKLAQQWAPGRRFLNAYGPTEATVCATIAHLIPEEIAASPRFLSIGRAMNNVQVYLLDPYQQPVPPGIPGELYIGGAGVARGYLNQPELSAQKFVPNPFGPGRLYRTGDRARYLTPANGQAPGIEFLGRMDNQVKLRGFRIELGEIEEVLMQHPAVQEAAVLAWTDDGENRQLVAYVAPNAAATAGEEEQIAHWQDVNTQIFGEMPAVADLSFNITGWSSSYTKLPFAPTEMLEWVNGTVAAILALKPQRVLEIGCGTGLLVSRIAPHCQEYLGVDFSPEVLHNIQQLKATEPSLAHVTLQQRTADNFEGLDVAAFDVVILNSVIQYFPSVDYLRRVLQGAVRVVKPGGAIFVGDVRSLPLLEAYHAAVQLATAEPSLTRQQMQQHVQRALQDEEELALDPRFFLALQEELPQIRQVEIQLKRGAFQNELIQFRYSAVLHMDEAGSTQEADQASAETNIQRLDWDVDQLTLTRLGQVLTQDAPSLLAVRHIPNRRVHNAVQITGWLSREQDETVADLHPYLAQQSGAVVDPEALWRLGEENGYQVRLTWSEMGAYPGGMDALFSRSDQPWATELLYGSKASLKALAWSDYANSPLQAKLRRKLAPLLAEFLQEKLPGYMLPASFVLLEKLPLNNSGKVDRRALPAPVIRRNPADHFSPPTTATEKKLAAIWCETLGLEQISIHDNFFDLGGNSLLVVQLAASISAGMEHPVTPKDLMLNPTIAQLAQVYTDRDQTASVQTPTRGAPVNGAGPAGQSALLPDVPHVHWEARSLLSLFVTGKLPAIDSAALAYLSSTSLRRSGLSRDEVVYEHFENLPNMSTIMQTPWGRIGLITLPRLGTELYQDPELMNLILEGLEMAGRFGAKVVSLTGLIPSATEYGVGIAAAVKEKGDLPRVTTGHATTSATVVLSLRRLLQEARRDLAQESVGFIGLGSVGMATLHLMLQVLPHPKRLILCDLFSKLDSLEESRRTLVEGFGFQGEIQLAPARTQAPDELYTATLLVGATNVPDVLDIDRVQPGTLLVDDSAPHCFDVGRAIQRLEGQEDILFTEGGVLHLPHKLTYQVHVPRGMESMMQDAGIFREEEVTGCVLSSLLSATYADLPPTVGLVDPQAGMGHYAKLDELGVGAAAPHIREYTVPGRVLRSFRYRFGA